MKMIVLTSQYPEKGNPYSHMFVHRRVVEMINQGASVKVLVASNRAKKYNYEGVAVHKLPSKKIIQEIDNKSLLYIHFLYIYPFSKANGWPIYKFIIKNNLKYAMYIHGYEAQKYSSRRYEFNYTLREALKWLKKDVFVFPQIKYFVEKTLNRGVFVFPSRWMRAEMEKNFKCKIPESSIIPNGVDTEYFKYRDQSEHRYKLLTIRSLSSKVYDIEATIEVIEHLPKEYTLDIYGKGIYLSQYQRLIDKKNLNNRVKIIPKFVDRKAMSTLFNNYGIFISTTRMDSQGITMMEAMASGLLVATTDNTSKREFIDNTQGVLAVRPKEMASKIVGATSSEKTFQRITKKARMRVEEIDIKKVTVLELDVLKKGIL